MEESVASHSSFLNQPQPTAEDAEDIAIILAKAYAIARVRARQVRAERQSQSPAKLDILPVQTEQ
jgi:hypothetical protein